MAKNISTVLSLSVVGKPSAGGGVGVGKSSLCNRLMRRGLDEFTPDKHRSTISQTDFVSPVINQDHFLFWGSICFNDEDFLLSLQILEHTEFTEDNTMRPFNATQNYIKRCTQLKYNSPGKMKYINCDQIAIPDEFEKEQCPNKINIDGFIFVFDVSVCKIAEQESQKKYAERLFPALVSTKKPIIFVATKCDNLDRDMLNYLIQLASKKKTYPIVETSLFKGINIDIPFLLMANQITKRFCHIKNLTYFDALSINEQAFEEMIILFQKYIDIEVIDYRLKVAQIIPNIKSDPIFARLSSECGSQKPRSMISQHLRKLREEVERVKSEEYIEKIMVALKSCLPSVPNENYTLDQCIQDIDKSEDFHSHFVKLSPGMHWVDVPEGEERISFGFLRTQHAKEFILQYKGRILYKMQVLLMTDEFELAISNAKHIVPGLPLEKALMLLPLGASWTKLDKSLKKQIYDNMQESLFKIARNDYLSLLMENVSTLIEYREAEDDYMFISNELKDETLKNDAPFHHFDFLPDKRSEIEFNFLATLNLPKGDYKISQLAQSIQKLAPTLNDLQIQENDLYSISIEDKLNVAIVGHPDSIEILKEDYIKASSDEKLEDGMKKWESIHFETFDFTKGQSNNPLFKPNVCVCFISKCEDIESMRSIFRKLFIPDVLHDADEGLSDDTRWFTKARHTKLWGIPIVLIATTKDIEDSEEIDMIHKDGQFLADSVQCAFICDTTTDHNLSLLTYNSIHLTLKCLLTTMNHRIAILKGYDSPINSELSVAVLSLPEDKFKTCQAIIPFLQNQMNWLESNDGQNCRILFDSVLNYNTRITISSSFFTVFNYGEIRSEIRHGFIFIFSVENKAAWEITRLYTHRYMKLAPVLLIAMLSDLKTNKLTRNAEELLHEARTFAMHYKLHLIGTSQSTWTAGSFAPFLDTIWNNRFTSALNQKKANPKQPTQNLRPTLPQLPSLPQATTTSMRSSYQKKKNSLAGPNERYMRRLYGSQDNLLDASGTDNQTIQLPDRDNDFVESGDEYDNTEETYDTLDSVQPELSPENKLLPHNNQIFKKTIFMPTSDVGIGDTASDFELIYDTLESVPKELQQLDTSLWKAPDRNSLLPVISIPSISTMGKQIESSYNLLSVEETEDIGSEVEESIAKLESCYSLLDAGSIDEDAKIRPKFPLPPFSTCEGTEETDDCYMEAGGLKHTIKDSQLQIKSLPEYTEVDACGNESIQEVIYDDRNFVGSSSLQISEYEEPSLLPPPQKNNQLKISDVQKEDFPSYNTTFQQNMFHSQDPTPSAEYSHIVLPKTFITSHVQPVSDYDMLHDARPTAEKIPKKKFITKSESGDLLAEETTKLQNFLSMEPNTQQEDQHAALKAIEAELEEQLAQFPSIQDFEDSHQIVTADQLSTSYAFQEGSGEHPIVVEEDLYASPQKIHSLKTNKPSSCEYYRDVEEIYADVAPPPLPVAIVNLAEDFEDMGIKLPPPPPRSSSLDAQVKDVIRPKFPDLTSSGYNSSAISDTIDSNTHSPNPESTILHSNIVEYPEERRRRTNSKKEKKEIEKVEKIKQRLERKSTKDNMKRTKSQSSYNKSSFSVAEESFTYFCKPLDTIIPPQRNIPIFLEHCVLAIEGMTPNGMETEGIYRVPANQEDMIKLINQFEANPSDHLTHHTQNIHTLSGTLKCFFQKLPEPLISEESAANLLKITDVKSKAGKAKLKDALSRISPKSYSVLEYLILHLHKVSLLSDENKMTARNLAITFWPSLFRPPVDLLAFQTQAPIFEQMIANMIEFPSILPVEEIISEDLYDSVRVFPH